MISREPTIERLAIARSLLLEPFGLTDATLSKALQNIAYRRSYYRCNTIYINRAAVIYV